MSAILSNRTLQFFNNETVFNLELKKTRFLPQGRFTAETIVDTSSGDVIEEVQQTNIDFIRYVAGLARYSKQNEDGSRAVDTLNKLFPTKVLVSGNQIRFDEQFQKDYRLPFYRITFSNKSFNKEGELELTFNSTQDVNFYFRNLDWVKIFYSPAVFLEFLERGDFNGPQYREIPSENINFSLEQLMIAVQNTLSFYNAGQLLFKKNPSAPFARVEPGIGGSFFSDLNIKTLAQLSETQVREEKDSNLEAISNLKFSVGETYNFLSREYEFGERAPSNKAFTLFEDSLLPSNYDYNIIEHLELVKESLLRERALPSEVSQLQSFIDTKRNSLFFGPFNLDFYYSGRRFKKRDLARNLYNQFGLSIKNLSDQQINTILENEEEQIKRRFVLIDTSISNNLTNETLFPFGNKIEIVDLPTNRFEILNILKKYNLETEILLNLINGIQSPDTEIRSTRKNLFIVDYFTGKTPEVSTRQIREFDFANVFNETTQNFFIEAPENKVSLLNPRSRSVRQNQIERFNNLYTTPYIPNLNSFNSSAGTNPLQFLEDLVLAFNKALNEGLANIQNIFLSNKNNYFEIIAYKVSKRNLNTQEQQHFFISNRPEEIAGFFDSQVKPGQEYTYNLSALSLVIENEYQYKTPEVEYGINVDPEVRNSLVLGASTLTRQKLKIVEFPLVEENSTILDAPPTAPNVEFYPLKDFNDRINIRLSTTNSTNFEKPIVVESNDRRLFDKIRKNQKLQVGDKIRFHSDETPAAYEVYRINFKPQFITDFISGKRIIKSVTANNRSSDGTMFQDRVVPNLDYYYLFRTLDFHGNVSNPTQIFKFTLVDNEGALQPLLTTVLLEDAFGVLKNDGSFSKKKKDQSSREIRKFIKIRPSSEEISFTRGQFEGKSSKDITSVILGNDRTGDYRSLGLGSESEIVNQKYALEFKSKKTGKSIFLEFTYSLNNIEINNLQTREKIEDTVTDKDIIDSIQRRELE